MIEFDFSNINYNTCIMLIPDERDEKFCSYIEPISKLKVTCTLLDNCSSSDIYDSAKGYNCYMMLGYNKKEFPPFGYITNDIYIRWKKETTSFSVELKDYLDRVNAQTLINFGDSFDEDLLDCHLKRIRCKGEY